METDVGEKRSLTLLFEIYLIQINSAHLTLEINTKSKILHVHTNYDSQSHMNLQIMLVLQSLKPLTI